MTFRCLFVTHKWGDAAPGTGESVTVPHLIDTFLEWGMGTHAVVWTDESYYANVDIVSTVEKAIAAFDPEVIVYTPIPAGSLEPQNVSPDAMRHLGRKAVSVFFDLMDKAARARSEKYAAASDLCVNIDGSPEPIGKRFLPLWPARTRRPATPKDIELSFVGARANYPDRRAALDLLASRHIPVMIQGGRAETMCSFDEYMDILDRSLIALNFSKTVSGASQIKARVFEALSAGCCLVEDSNEITTRYLMPGVDYIAWERLDQLPELINYLLANKDVARRIAQNGQRKFGSKYSAGCFWDALVAQIRNPGHGADAIRTMDEAIAMRRQPKTSHAVSPSWLATARKFFSR